VDYHFAPDVLAGFALAGGGTNWGLSQGLGGGRSDAFQAGIYGMMRTGPAYLSAALAFTNYWMSTDRYAFAGDHLAADFNAQSFGGRVETGYRFPTLSVAVTPYAAAQAVNFRTPNYSERDLSGGGYALAFASRDATDTRIELGARFDHPVIVGNGMLMLLRGRLAWAHDWVTAPSLLASFQTLPGASFIVTGASPAKDSILASAGSELRITPSLSLDAKFEGEFASHSQTYGGIGTLRYMF
jgi:outer membrane autotransporter protein